MSENNSSRMKKKQPLGAWFYSNLIVSVTAIIVILVSYPHFNSSNSRAVKSIEFAINRVNHLVQEGDVVSLDKNGVLRQGAGTTLYRNIQEIHNQTLYHLHTVVIQETIHVAQYDSEMLVTVFDPDTDEIIATDTFTLPIIHGHTHRVDDLIVLQDNLVLSFGSNQAIPAHVEFIEGEIKVEFGEPSYPYSFQTIQPELRRLNDSCAIVSCYHTGAGNQIALVAGCLTSQNMNMTWGPLLDFSEDYTFHDLSSFTGDRFIVVHAQIPWFEGQNKVDDRIHYGLGRVNPDLSVSVDPIQILELKSFGFLDMAHLDENNTVLSFINEDNNNGMTSIIFHYNKEKDVIVVGSKIDHQTGDGSSRIGGLYSFIHVRAFSPKRFGLYYSDMADGAATALSIVDITPAGDLVPFGPEFILAPGTNNNDAAYYWTNLAPTGHERFFVMESLTIRKGDVEPHASIHVGEIYNSPLGVVTSLTSTKATVVVDGVIESKEKLTPGKEYLGNSNGQLVEGDYVGEFNRNSYPVYSQKGNRLQILTTSSQVGYAIGENELLVHIPEYIDVSCICFKQVKAY